MQWTEEILINIERMAAAAFNLQDIADILEVDVNFLETNMAIKDNPFRKAYRKGFLQRQLELRERIFKDAKNGSSPAQTIANKLLTDVIISQGLQ